MVHADYILALNAGPRVDMPSQAHGKWIWSRCEPKIFPPFLFRLAPPVHVGHDASC
jgi:hypothetical protein